MTPSIRTTTPPDVLEFLQQRGFDPSAIREEDLVAVYRVERGEILSVVLRETTNHDHSDLEPSTLRTVVR